MYAFELSPAGERLSTGQPKSYFRVMRDLIANGLIFRREASEANFPGCA